MLREIWLDFDRMEESEKNKVNKLYWDTQFIGALYHHHLGKLTTGRCQKLMIRGVKVVKERFEDFEHRDTIGLVIYSSLFDFEKLDKANEPERKKILLDFLHKGAREVFTVKEWDDSTLEKAYRASLDAGIIYRWYLARSLKSPINKDLCYHIEFVWNWDNVDCFIVTKENKSGDEISRQLFFQTIGRTFEQKWDLCFGEDKKEIVLTSRYYKNVKKILVSEIVGGH